MLEKGKISLRQLVWMIIGYFFCEAIIISPAMVYAKQDAWISNLIAIAFGILYILFLSKFFNLLQGKSFVEYTISIFGKVGGRIIILPIILYLILDGGLVIREIEDLLTTAVYEKTPVSFFSITIVLICAFTIKKGIEVIGRNCEILIPVTIIGLFLFLFLILSTTIKIDYLKPVFSNGIIPILKGTLPLIGFPILDSIIFLFFLPLINKANQTKVFKGFALALLISGTFLAFRPIMAVGTFGPEEAPMMPFPIFDVVKMIKFGDIIERLESFFLPIWISTSYIKIVIIYYVVTVSLSEWFSLSDYKPLILPLGFIFVSLSIFVAKNISEILKIGSLVWFPLSVIISIIIPILIFTTGIIKRKKNN